MPLVSIVLPTYNRGQTIGAAIKSVLAQTFIDWELIVVDDGSEEPVAELVAALVPQERLQLIRHKTNLGLPASLNDGLAASRGELIARIDDDDLWIDPGKLAAQVAFLKEHPDCVLVGTGAVTFDIQGRELWRFLNPATDAEIRQRILGRPCFVHPSVLYRAAAARAVGGYDKNIVEDYSLWLKLGQQGTLANLPIAAVRYTLTPGGHSRKYAIKQGLESLRLAHRYRHNYPNYARGQVRNLARLLWYGAKALVS